MFSKKIRKSERKSNMRSFSLINTTLSISTIIIISILQKATSQNFHFIIYRLIIIFIIIIIISNSINIAFQTFSFIISILAISFITIIIASNIATKIC
nr:MAG TPA: hypothetical protein [Crassvirales sp.]